MYKSGSKKRGAKLIEGKWDGAVAENRVGCDRTACVGQNRGVPGGKPEGRAERD